MADSCNRHRSLGLRPIAISAQAVHAYLSKLLRRAPLPAPRQVYLPTHPYLLSIKGTKARSVSLIIALPVDTGTPTQNTVYLGWALTHLRLCSIRRFYLLLSLFRNFVFFACFLFLFASLFHELQHRDHNKKYSYCYHKEILECCCDFRALMR